MMKLKSLLIFLTTNMTINAVNGDAFKLVNTFNIETGNEQNRLNTNADRVNNNLKNERKKIADGLIQILVKLDEQAKLTAHKNISADDNSNKKAKKSFFPTGILSFFKSQGTKEVANQQNALTVQKIIRDATYYNSMMQNLQEKYKITPLLCAVALKSEGINLNDSAIKKYVEFLDVFFVKYCDVLTNFDIKYLFAVSIARIFENEKINFVWFKKDKNNNLIIGDLESWFNLWYQDCKKNLESNKELLVKFDDSIKKSQKWRDYKKTFNQASLQIAYTNVLIDLLKNIAVSKDVKDEIIKIIDNQSKIDYSNHILQMLIIYELINKITVKSLDNISFDKMFNKMIEIKVMEAEAEQQEMNNLRLEKRQFKGSKANANEDHNSEAYSVVDSSSWNSSEITTLDGSVENLGSDSSSND